MTSMSHFGGIMNGLDLSIPDTNLAKPEKGKRTRLGA